MNGTERDILNRSDLTRAWSGDKNRNNTVSELVQFHINIGYESGCFIVLNMIEMIVNGNISNS